MIKPKDETGFDPFIQELFVRAIGLYEAMQGASPAGQVQMIDNPLVSGAEVIVVFTSTPEGMKLLYVRGISKRKTLREIPVASIGAFMAADVWTYSAWRIAYGDLQDDITFRNFLRGSYPEAYRRLPKWVTPAGFAERVRLRADRSAYEEHMDLVLIDNFTRDLHR